MKQPKHELNVITQSKMESSVDNTDASSLTLLQKWLMLIADEIARDLVTSHDNTNEEESHASQQ